MPLQLSQAFANLFAKKTTAEHTHSPMPNSGNLRQSLLDRTDSQRKYFQAYGSAATQKTKKTSEDGTKVDYVSLTEETDNEYAVKAKYYTGSRG